jgi:hypothetical protein
MTPSEMTGEIPTSLGDGRAGVVLRLVVVVVREGSGAMCLAETSDAVRHRQDGASRYRPAHPVTFGDDHHRGGVGEPVPGDDRSP